MNAGLDIEDHAALAGYLRATQRLDAGGPLVARTLAGGVSNKTVWVRLPDGREWVIKQALAKLRVQADWFSDPARIHREALALRWLGVLLPVGATVDFVFEDEAAQHFAMTAVPEPHENWKVLLLAEGPRRAQVETFGRLLATLHGAAAARAAELRPLFHDARFFTTLRLDPYYVSAAAAVPAAAEFLHELVREVRRECHTLVHGDYSPKNVLVHAGRLVLLDHEVAYWGDPAFDLGFALTHFLSKANHRPDRRAAFAGAANDFWRAYAAIAGGAFPALEPRAVKHTLACLLARVAGRSPLEYLSPAERDRQQRAVLGLIAELPDCVETLVGRYVALVSDQG